MRQLQFEFICVFFHSIGHSTFIIDQIIWYILLHLWIDIRPFFFLFVISYLFICKFLAFIYKELFSCPSDTPAIVQRRIFLVLMVKDIIFNLWTPWDADAVQ